MLGTEQQRGGSAHMYGTCQRRVESRGGSEPQTDRVNRVYRYRVPKICNRSSVTLDIFRVNDTGVYNRIIKPSQQALHTTRHVQGCAVLA